jgi:hypothetical protein
MTILLESKESSSPIITRAVANGLKGLGLPAYEFSTFQRFALRVIGQFPKQTAEWIIPRVQPSNAFSSKDIANLTSSDLVKPRLRDYEENIGKFPSVTIGVGMGGTTVHLAIALGGPFLPQAFVLTLKGGTRNGDVKYYFELCRSTSLNIANKNPDLMTIQHYDPVHDGWLVKRVNHLRLKLIDLPFEYKNFIREKVIKGGEVIYLEGEASWKRFRVGDHSVFQVGGWGDLSAEEFINGSGRLDAFCKKERLDYSSWKLPEYDIEDGPESEWGSEPGMGDAIEGFCSEEGYQFIKIKFSDPNDFSRLAFQVQRKKLQLEQREEPGVVIEMFSQFDAMSVKNGGLLPLWLIFNTKDSLRFLLEMKNEFPKDKPVFFSPLSTFSETPDLVTWQEWEKALKGFNVINIGTRKSHYPADVLTLLDWKKSLNKWVEKNIIKSNVTITGKELSELAEKVRTS